ncbi:hypothetical protein [Carnobacterium divergens]|uniref:hypothetical protein n=1 Tax=Carnobacterium divergens TaxID=2748 RepID=UPI0007F5225E|nr:hypothetical protein [Carnobacterium divergens]MDT2011137.1 hypothetical protein [Carnobacterium divergens]SBO16969.1 hypothetical protein CDIV41_260004 [Carnobacterium divergens]
MKRLSFARTEREIKKELKLLKEIQSKMIYFGNFTKKDIAEEIIRLNEDLAWKNRDVNKPTKELVRKKEHSQCKKTEFTS